MKIKFSYYKSYPIQSPLGRFIAGFFLLVGLATCVLSIFFFREYGQVKDELVVEGSIIPIDRASYGFSSDAQNMMTEINYKSIMANLIVAEGDLEENWKNVIAEYAYIVDPAVAELNELFGAK